MGVAVPAGTLEAIQGAKPIAPPPSTTSTTPSSTPTSTVSGTGGGLVAADPAGPSVSSRIAANIGNSDDPKMAELLTGAQFGEAVLGPEGLGRLGTQQRIQTIEQEFGRLAGGLTGKERQAAREQALQQIGQGTQAQMRATQAALARAGVRGGAAGEQLTKIALGGLQQRKDFERDLVLRDRAARERAMGQLADFATGTRQFDISQAAREKNIPLQAGLGFASLGAAERGANLAAQAIGRAPAPSSSGGLLGGGFGLSDLAAPLITGPAKVLGGIF